jgi:hypothetical protein
VSSMNLLCPLKPQDVLVLSKLLVWDESAPWSFALLASELGMSSSEVHAAIKRAERSDLYEPLTRRPKRQNLREFFFFGLRYSFPGHFNNDIRGKGIPTAHSASPLNKEITSIADDKLVWETKRGKVSGILLSPLYRSVPNAASRDSRLYEVLALLDALRVGGEQDRELAKDNLEKILGSG